MKTDPLTLRILADHCVAAAEAMAYTLMRTAHSTFVKETEDFSCGILTPDGLTFASPKGLGATWFIGLDYGPVIAAFDDYREGDIYITNDPYSGAVATHTPDIHIWKPVFVDGRLICFVAGHIHNTDMGGAVPATLSRSLAEIHQEGLRIPPTRIVRDGRLDEHLPRILRANVRVPDQNWGDLNAQIASLAVGERKIKEIAARFGVRQLEDGIADLLDYAEAQARRVVEQMPDGTYFHAEYADEDSEGGDPCRIAITLTIRDGSLELDFTGSDPQLTSSLNMPTEGRGRHALVMVGVGYILYTLGEDLLMNAGTLRVANAILPRGTIVNPVAPAAVGMRSLACNVTQIATFGVFAKAMPDLLPASPSGGSTIINIRTIDSSGHTIMASIGPVTGGAGGGPEADGSEGAGANTAFLRNTPVEINEVEVPVRFRRYGLQPDTGGAGRWRGGSGIIMEFEVFSPQTIVTARNQDRTKFGCWGLNGGKSSMQAFFHLLPAGGEPIDLGNTDIVRCGPGDVIRAIGSAGGGWGDPLQRPAESVEDDVRCGYVSAASALADYGVVIDEGLDVAATKAERDRRRGAVPNSGKSVALRTFEAVWSPERYDALTRILAATPVQWRHWLKGRIFAAVRTQPDVPGADLIYRIHAEICRGLPQLRAQTEDFARPTI